MQCTSGVLGRFRSMRERAEQNALRPWEAMRQQFAPDDVTLRANLARVKALFPYAKGQGVCYINFQRDVPNGRSGTLHVTSLNPFCSCSFASGLYWQDLELRVSEAAAAGTFPHLIRVAPVTGVPGATISSLGQGLLGYGADGAYANSVYLCAASFLAFAASKDFCHTQQSAAWLPQ